MNFNFQMVGGGIGPTAGLRAGAIRYRKTRKSKTTIIAGWRGK